MLSRSRSPAGVGTGRVCWVIRRIAPHLNQFSLELQVLTAGAEIRQEAGGEQPAAAFRTTSHLERVSVGAAGLANCGTQTSFAACGAYVGLSLLESARKRFPGGQIMKPRDAVGGHQGKGGSHGWGQTDITRGRGDGSFHLSEEGNLPEVGNSSPDQAFGPWGMWRGQLTGWGDTCPFGML